MMDGLMWFAVGVVTFLGAVLAAGAGTGGGALYMPAYVLIFDDAHRAVPLAKVTILGVALSSVLQNVRKKHPHSNRPLINYEISALLEPLTLVGATVGVLLNLILSSRTILILLVIVLSATAAKTLATGLKQFKSEGFVRMDLEQRHSDSGLIHNSTTKKIPPDENAITPQDVEEEGSRQPLLTDSTTSNLVGQGSPRSFRVRSGSGGVELGLPPSSQRRGADSPEVSGLPPEIPLPVRISESARGQGDVQPFESHKAALIFLVVDWALNIFLLFAAGGPHALACGEHWQISVISCLQGIHIILTAAFAYYLYRCRVRRAELNIKEMSIEEGGYAWVVPSALVGYPFLALFAGMCAGALGIGGGLIKGPLLLEIGISPLSAVMTSTFMILFTSSTTTLSFALTGRLEWVPSISCFAIAFVASIVGVHLITMLINKYRRQSIITFTLFFVILISMFCMIFSSFYEDHHPLYGRHPKALTLQDACFYLHHHPSLTDTIKLSPF